MSQPLILTDKQGCVATVTINRPDKKNALTLDMYRSLIDAMKKAEADDEVRVFVIKGEGGVFTAGNDILDFVATAGQAGSNGKVELPEPLLFLQTISSFSKPVIAAVSGNAVGIGTSMLLHCDLVYASDDARFQMPFAKLGLVPEGGTSLLIPQMLGHKRAFELLVLGEHFNTERAVELGIVNEQVTDADAKADEVANQLAQMAPEAVCQSKKMLKEHTDDTLQNVLVNEVDQFVQRLQSDEAKEAFAAFIEKRAPKF